MRLLRSADGVFIVWNKGFSVVGFSVRLRDWGVEFSGRSPSCISYGFCLGPFFGVVARRVGGVN